MLHDGFARDGIYFYVLERIGGYDAVGGGILIGDGKSRHGNGQWFLFFLLSSSSFCSSFAARCGTREASHCFITD